MSMIDDIRAAFAEAKPGGGLLNRYALARYLMHLRTKRTGKMRTSSTMAAYASHITKLTWRENGPLVAVGSDTVMLRKSP
jgi:hypothetical protein